MNIIEHANEALSISSHHYDGPVSCNSSHTVISILIVLNYAGLKGVVKIKTGLITPVSPMPTGVQ